MPAPKYFWYLSGTGIVLAALALLIVAVRAGAGLMTGALIHVFQATVLLLAVAAGIVVVIFILFLLGRVMQSVEDLSKAHQTLLSSFKRRTGVVVATCALGANVVVLLADGSFHERHRESVALCILLVVLFAFANELLAGSTPLSRNLGLTLWLLGDVSLPALVMIDRHWWPRDLLRKFVSFEVVTQAAFIVDAVIMIAFPICFWLLERRASRARFVNHD